MQTDKIHAVTELLTTRLQPSLAYVRPIVGGVALVFFAGFAFLHFETLQTTLTSAQPLGVCIAFLLLIVSHLFMPLHVVIALRDAAWSPGYADALSLYARRIPARYMPGGVWHLAARVLDLHALGVPKQSLAIIALHQSTSINGFAFILGGGGVYVEATNPYTAVVGLLGAACGVAMIFGSMWFVSRRLMNSADGFTARALFWMGVVLLGVITLFGFSFAAYLTALPQVAVQAPLPFLVSVVLFARGVAFLAFFAPKGIGVFEAVAASLLAGQGQFASAAFVIFAFRGLGFAADVVVWSAAYMLHNPLKRESPTV